jgi:hypothetical protein
MSVSNTGGTDLSGVCLRLLACWDCGFGSCRGRGCLVLSGRGVCDGPITGPEEFYRVWCVWVPPWSLDYEEALTHWGLLRDRIQRPVGCYFGVSLGLQVRTRMSLLLCRACAYTRTFAVSMEAYWMWQWTVQFWDGTWELETNYVLQFIHSFTVGMWQSFPWWRGRGLILWQKYED